MTTAITCPRCLGSGQTTHRHIDGGRCFQCEGTGRATLKPGTVRAPASSNRGPVSYCRDRFVGLRSSLRHGYGSVEDFCSTDRETGVCGYDAVRHALTEITDAALVAQIKIAFAGLGVSL